MKKNEQFENDIKFLLKKRTEQNKNPYDTHLSVGIINEILKDKNLLKNLTI
jgi:hypothetical protein